MADALPSQETVLSLENITSGLESQLENKQLQLYSTQTTLVDNEFLDEEYGLGTSSPEKEIPLMADPVVVKQNDGIAGITGTSHLGRTSGEGGLVIGESPAEAIGQNISSGDPDVQEEIVDEVVETVNEEIDKANDLANKTVEFRIQSVDQLAEVEHDLAAGSCLLPPDAGSCSGAEIRFFYEPDLTNCREFVYTGCGGNGNNFHALESCLVACKLTVSPNGPFLKQMLQLAEIFTLESYNMSKFVATELYRSGNEHAAAAA